MWQALGFIPREPQQINPINHPEQDLQLHMLPEEGTAAPSLSSCSSTAAGRLAVASGAGSQSPSPFSRQLLGRALGNLPRFIIPLSPFLLFFFYFLPKPNGL